MMDILVECSTLNMRKTDLKTKPDHTKPEIELEQIALTTSITTLMISEELRNRQLKMNKESYF